MQTDPWNPGKSTLSSRRDRCQTTHHVDVPVVVQRRVPTVQRVEQTVEVPRGAKTGARHSESTENR